MVVFLCLQSGMNWFLSNNKLLYAPHDTITDLHTFKEIISDPKTEDGFPMYLDDDRNDIWIFYLEDYEDYEYLYNQGTYKMKPYKLHKDEILKELIPTANEQPDGIRSFSEPYGYQFYHLNRTIVHYEISNNDDLLPIYTYSVDQLNEANHISVIINLLYMLIYVVIIAVTMIIYNSKRKKL